MIFLGLGGSLWILNNKKATNAPKFHSVNILYLRSFWHLPSGPDDESNLGLGFNIEVAVLLGSTLSIDELLVSSGVLGGVLSG